MRRKVHTKKIRAKKTNDQGKNEKIKRKSVRSEQQYKKGAEPRWEGGPVGFFVKERK